MFGIDDFESTKHLIKNYDLTERELVIFNLIKQKKNLNIEIKKLGISKSTLKMYLKKIEMKTNRYKMFPFQFNYAIFFNKLKS